MVKNSLMLFSPSPKSLSKLVIGYTLSQKFVEAGYWPHLFHARTPSPKSCRSWLLGTLHPNHYPHAQLHINSHTPYTHTNHTPTIHNPTTPPIPLLLRVDSDEMWQKPTGFWLMRCWNARLGPVWGQKSTKWTPRVAQTRLGRSSKVVCCACGRNRRWMRRVSPNPAEFAPSKFPQTFQYFRKSHKQ